MFNRIITLFENFLLEMNNDLIIVKDCKESRIKGINTNNQELWNCSIVNCAGQFLSVDDEHFIFFENGISTLFNKKDGKKVLSEGKYYFYYNNNKKIFVDLTNTKFIIFEYNNIRNQVNYTKQQKLFYSEYLFQYSSSIISCTSFHNSQELWQVDVGVMGKWLDYDGKTLKPGEVKNLYSVGEKHIVAEIERSALACIELETGKVVWQFNGPYTTHFLVSLYKDVFCVFSDFYYEISVETGAILRKEDYTSLLEKAKLKQYMLTAPAINDGYIAIASHYDNAILVINRETFTVHQRIELEGCQNGIPLGNTPRLYGNRLFQQDGDGTLHIFEEV